jgi:Family of unknown function (DUF5681)
VDNDNRDGRYEVGYRKPPRHTRFRKGRSGNPRGRPRGSKNLGRLLDEALDERLVINEGGRKRTASKRQVIMKQLVNRAAQGDYRSISLVLSYRQKHSQNGSEDRDKRLSIVDLLRLVGPLPDGLSLDTQQWKAQQSEAKRVVEAAPALLPGPAATEDPTSK